MPSLLKVLARDTAGRATRAEIAHDAGIKVGDIKLTAEGYMIAEGVPVARVGVQEYSALELGLDASMKTIRLYRSPDEVFSAESVASLDRKPITYYHPERGVDASNYKAVAVGRVEAPAQDGDFLKVGRFEVNDGETVQAVAFGVKEVSCGYSFTPDMTPGTTPAGEAFDGQMRRIEHNHVAIVYRGRCGSGCAVGDCACSSHEPNRTSQGDTPMATRSIHLGKFTITLDEKDATIVESQFGEIAAARDAEAKRATDAETALAAQGEAMKKLATDSAKELADAKAQILTPEQHKATLAELVKVTADAKLVAPEFVTDGKTAAEIRVGVIDHVIAKDAALPGGVAAKAMLGGAEPAKAGAVVINGAFDAIVALRGTATTATDSAYERQLRNAIGDKPTNGAGKEWTGEEIYQYRLTHGGKNPTNFAA